MKRNNNFLLVFFVCLVSLTACQNREDINKNFPLEKQLHAVKIPIKEIIDMACSNVVVVNNRIVITSPRTDTVVYVYSLPDFNLLRCFGTKGQGPNEFQEPYIVASNMEHLYLYGYNNQNFMKKLNIFSSSENLVLKEFTLMNIYHGLRNLTVINDSVLYYFEGKEFHLSLQSYNLISGKSMHQRELKVKEYHNLDWAYSNNGILSANEQTVAYAYEYKNKIDFMNRDFSIKKIIRGEQAQIQINNYDMQDNKIYYLGYYSGKEKFYFLYQGCSKNDMEKEEKRKYIEVYSQEGDPLVRYQLDSLIYNFTIDEKNNQIYGNGADDDSIYMFDMKQ